MAVPAVSVSAALPLSMIYYLVVDGHLAFCTVMICTILYLTAY